MKVKVIATTATKPEKFEGNEDFEKFSGKVAGVCYMKDNYDALSAESIEKTLKRANMTKISGHHSVYDHEYLSLYLEDVPKLFAMLLNNEKAFNTSEKSDRYTKMQTGTKLEHELYQKWLEIFKQEIQKKYGENNLFFTENKIEKLAQENARYFLSVYTPTSLVYTVSYRQLNYLVDWLDKIKNTENPYLEKLAQTIDDFNQTIKQLNLFDKNLSVDTKDRELSLFAQRKRSEVFDEMYSVNYLGSWASLAQAQRHRTLNYEVSPVYPPQFYVPKIIQNNEKLKKEWLDDMEKVKDLHPQGELVEINERGTPENFILKTKERLCTMAQLEVEEQTKSTLQKYIDKTQNNEVKQYLEKYNHGARCTAGYECKNKCHFKEGINLEREI